MCGRISVGTTSVDYSVFFGVSVPDDFRPRYNLGPTQPIPVIRNHGNDESSIDMVRWGLVPRWAKQVGASAPLINARLETVSEKPSFRDSFAKRRCLVLADGFYEWLRRGRQGSAPHRFCRTDGKPFAMAGIWDEWQSNAGEPIVSCAVITCPPNALVEPIHDRMPVILDPLQYESWLQPGAVSPSALRGILDVPSGDGFQIYEVCKAVNSVRNDTSECHESPRQTSFF